MILVQTQTSGEVSITVCALPIVRGIMVLGILSYDLPREQERMIVRGGGRAYVLLREAVLFGQKLHLRLNSAEP